ncbi:MAG: VWA domain-containing protein [Crenarchaeota archaeon]|nr:VWA domain-containing protein [Thermoproteota archaeon]
MSIELKVRLAKIEVAADTPDVVPFVVSVEGVKPSGLPSAYLIAIDTSLSMDGSKIFRAKEAALRILDSLRPSDLVSVYGFNSRVERAAKLVPASRREELEKAIVGLRLGGGTNIHAVLRELEKDAAAALRGGSVGSVKVLIVTDGNPTAGPKSVESIAAAARDLGKHVSAALIVGVGEDYNEKLLAEVARNLNGFFEHVSHPDQLSSLIPRFVAEYRDVSAKSVRVVIKSVPGVDVNVFGRESYLTKEGLEIPIGDVHYGEKVSVAGEFLLAPQPSGARVLAQVRARFVDPKTGREAEVSAEPVRVVALPPEQVSSVAVDERVLVEVSAVKLAESLSKALATSSGGARAASEELKKKVEEILNTTLSLGREDLYQKTIDLQERLRREGLSPEAYKELMSLISRILSGRLAEAKGG